MIADGIGLVAGGGAYPVLLARRLRQQGRAVMVAGISGHAIAADYPDCQFRTFRIGQIRATSRWFRAEGATRAVLAGGIHLTGRTTIVPDLALLPALPRLLFGGDDWRLRYIAGAFEKRGVTVISPKEWIEAWFPEKGHLAGPPLNEKTMPLLARGIAECNAFSRHDVGQSVVVHGSNWTGRENRRGTDALLKTAPEPGAILVKMKKKTQDTRFDIPSIGPGTVNVAEQMGVSAIAIESQEVMVIELKKTLHLCHDLNISLLAF